MDHQQTQSGSPIYIAAKRNQIQTSLDVSLMNHDRQEIGSHPWLKGIEFLDPSLPKDFDPLRSN
jgi:hypothetical protein